MKFIFVIVLAIFSSLHADIPEGYYYSAAGLSGEDLKSALHDIIDDHVEFPYTSTSTDTWDILKETDRDPNNPDNVILIYTGWSVDAAQEYNNGQGWSREHVWAKSHGDFGTAIGAGTDVHNLRPCDISVNPFMVYFLH
ncbi:MAG: endonuclease [Candidatus Tenebribacter mawsonii]|nr:endonuclease [Candidatus Tenebribacter mawsonii]